MLTISAFIVLLGVVVLGLSTSEFEERPGYCRDGDIYIKEGEEAGGPIGKCMRMKCVNATVGHQGMTGVGCAHFMPRKGCHRSAYDNTKRYPDCCPKRVCPDEIEDKKHE